ncbi:MAG TPA: DUF362 domain-containing protein [Acidobacteriota bacterium]|jgi:uncharacterized protein (DUF362 family)
MQRRTFLKLLAASQIPLPDPHSVPRYHVVSNYRAARHPGMPGRYRGRVISVRSANCIDETTDRVDAEVVRQMIARGICALTGESRPVQAWRRFFQPSDVVGIKVNCSGHPRVVSAPEIVAEIISNLMAVGVQPAQIYLYERYKDQLDDVNYAPHLPPGVQILAAEARRGGVRQYDPATYVEVDFFGEEDTRSNLIRTVSERITKIVNIPNMKDHGASGVTGCLKNIAYGSFSNVARSHQGGYSFTHSFIGTLAAVEPLRSRTVLQIMDGLRGVWHGGPFLHNPRFLFYPKRILLGTDPVAIDRLLLDVIEHKRKAEGAISVWDRSPQYLQLDQLALRDQDPNVNIIIREPGHIEYASRLGLGVCDLRKIRVKEITV